MKRSILLSVLFISLVTALYSGTFIIEDYTFDITGSTKEQALRRELDSGEEIFSSREELTEALDEKVRGLNNRRIFKSVSYTTSEREDGNVTYVSVDFVVVDAKTLLIIPYGKYDSNTGLIAAVKVTDKNILGSLSRTSSTTSVCIPSEGVKKTYLEENLTFWSVPVGDASMYFHFDGSTRTGNFGSKLVFDHVPLGAFSFDTSFQVIRKDGDIKYTYTLLFKAEAGRVSFRPYLEVVFNDEKNGSYILPRLEIGNVRAGSASFDFETLYRAQSPSGYSFRSSEVKHTTLLSFTERVLQPFSCKNVLYYRFGSYFETDNTLSWKFTESTSFHVAQDMRFYESGSSRYDTGIGISQKIEIGSAFSITATLMEYLRAENDGTGFSFGDYHTLTASASSDSVEWKDSFRRGMSWNISVGESWLHDFPSMTIDSEKGLYNHLEITGHWIVSSWFNPSVRLIASMTDDREEHGSLGNSSLGEYIRGVRNSTVTEEGRDSNKITAVLNADFLFRLPLPVESFSLFLNPFTDVLYTWHDETDKGRAWFGFGLEIIGVLTDYPAYPVRISFGVDCEKLVKHLRKESGNGNFFEIFMGTDFFF